MSRCAVCGVKFGQELVVAEMKVTEKVQALYDPDRNKNLMVHLKCDKTKYITKAEREADYQKKIESGELKP